MPQRKAQLLVTALESMKFQVEAVLAATMTNQPVAQVTLILTFEVAFAMYQAFNDIKVSLALRITDRIKDTLTIIYLTCKLIFLISERLRGEIIAVIMVVSVYGIIVVSISFALFSLILILFQLCKRAILWCRSRSRRMTLDSLAKVSPLSNNSNSPRIRASNFTNRARLQGLIRPKVIVKFMDDKNEETGKKILSDQKDSIDAKIIGEQAVNSQARSSIGVNRGHRLSRLELPHIEQLGEGMDEQILRSADREIAGMDGSENHSPAQLSTKHL